jgi:hypothetical protein
MEPSELRVTTDELIGPRLDQLQRNAMIAAGIGLVLSAIGLFLDLQHNDPRAFFVSYLFAYLFWFGVTTGSLALLMVHHTVGGGWGFLIRRFLEAGSRMLPWAAVLFLPVLVGLLRFDLYEWVHPKPEDAELLDKVRYLNVPFFIGRAIFYFAVWIGFSWKLNQWGATQDERADPEIAHRLNVVSAFGIVVYALTITFAAVDWVMSLTPHWYSSIFGLLTVVSQGLSTLSLMVFLVNYLAGDKPIIQEVPRGYFRDLGNLMLAFVMLWAYMSFSQYIITYSGNTVEEIQWYVVRRQGGWGIVSLSLIALHFGLPFLVLLIGSRIKKNPARLAQVAAFIIFMRFVDLFWWVTPTFRPTLSINPADLGTPLLIGGIWLWLWVGQVRGRTVVPLHDPRLESGLRELAHHG